MHSSKLYTIRIIEAFHQTDERKLNEIISCVLALCKVCSSSFLLSAIMHTTQLGWIIQVYCRLLKMVFRTVLMGLVYFHMRDRNGRYLYLGNNEKTNERDGKRWTFCGIFSKCRLFWFYHINYIVQLSKCRVAFKYSKWVCVLKSHA